ncbi:hypothetical protein E2C01_062463 [Portunus trituberculatus]|uniref:Uncharacterized protein n=1 Tax=Portunus trituberculatus TaxID=210409 RepID=A0A5B7HE46_PORTR|nr:hypothetical protein [Portunus trituberculatus]
MTDWATEQSHFVLSLFPSTRYSPAIPSPSLPFLPSLRRPTPYPPLTLASPIHSLTVPRNM